jgi:hypothetical protein
MMQKLLVALYAAPWAWLVSFAVFVAAVTVKVGHFPSYSQPDPKHVEGLSYLYLLTILLLGFAAASPFAVAAHLTLTKMRGASVQPARVAVFGLGLLLCAAVIIGDAFGLGTWLFD